MIQYLLKLNIDVKTKNYFRGCQYCRYLSCHLKTVVASRAPTNAPATLVCPPDPLRVYIVETTCSGLCIKRFVFTLLFCTSHSAPRMVWYPPHLTDVFGVGGGGCACKLTPAHAHCNSTYVPSRSCQSASFEWTFQKFVFLVFLNHYQYITYTAIEIYNYYSLILNNITFFDTQLSYNCIKCYRTWSDTYYA